ncbi:MAG: Rieske (2Fe-2S) protein [Planctomycetaceae bacterium]|nr:Rieske (2Fe-2S) protein [Planctomycetaceae bacterium]
MSETVRIASVTDIPPGSGKEFVVGDRVLAVYNVDGEFHAMDGICPHAGGPLGKGTVTGHIVTCPWHGWQFDVTTGRHCLSPQIHQTGYPCRIVEQHVWIDLP